MAYSELHLWISGLPRFHILRQPEMHWFRYLVCHPSLTMVSRKSTESTIKMERNQNNLSRMVCWWYLLHISKWFFCEVLLYIYNIIYIYILLCILIYTYIDMLYLRIWVRHWHASLKRIHSSAQITTTYGEVVRSVKLYCFGWFISHSFKLKSIRVLPLALEAPISPEENHLPMKFHLFGSSPLIC